MQKTYNSIKGIKRSTLVWGAVALTGLASLFGCTATMTEEKRVQRALENYKTPNIVNICFATDKNPLVQKAINDYCKESIIAQGEVPREDYIKQGKEMFWMKHAAMTNLLYNEGNQVFFFSKRGERYATRLDTLASAKLHLDVKGNQEWKYSPFMTKVTKNGNEIFKAIDLMKQEERDERLNVQNNNNQNNDVIDRATGNTMGNLSTMGWMQFLDKYGK